MDRPGLAEAAEEYEGIEPGARAAVAAALAAGPLLFNFSASYSGGGYKRLYNYAKWFDSHGGAAFVINRRVAALAADFPRNRYFFVAPGRWSRLWRDGAYLRAILREIGKPALYYSYGIPLFARFGHVNWFHLSNALPVACEPIPLSLFERIKFALLSGRIRRGLAHADVIAAESKCSLDLIGREYDARLFVSGNGFDDGIAELGHDSPEREELAVLVGTYRYKALEDALRVFELLRRTRPALCLRVFGPVESVPRALRQHPAVELAGVQPPAMVISALRAARCYISTSLIENSSNADLEGTYLAEEAWLSDIGPHREMLAGSPWKAVAVPGMDRPMLCVRGAELVTEGLQSWPQVIGAMLARFAAVAGLPEAGVAALSISAA